MRFIADLHIHSRYSRATSTDMTPEALWRWAQLKGIAVAATGDFTHPKWFRELNDKLEPLGNGLFRLRKEYCGNDVPASCRADVIFMLSAEISCIYSKNGRTRKVHSLVYMPDFQSAVRFNIELARIGNLNSDGRPILGLDAKQLLAIALECSPDAMFVPAHAWTPHFSVFGAASGFDSLEECFEDLAPNIYAIETGLSSDPAMNRRISALDKITLISNSDAHSASKLGREANIFDAELSYSGIMQAIKTGMGFSGTIEFFPEEGKYHLDGHRDCGVSLTPEETKRYDYLCPVCGKKVTVGVMHRVSLLADREEGNLPAATAPFRSVIPFIEIVGETLGMGVTSKAVNNLYQSVLAALGNEFSVLLEVPVSEIEQASTPRLAEALSRMRQGSVNIAPGYDGEFGKIKIFEEVARQRPKGQTLMF